MNAVFHCPRCNTQLGTSDDPRPDPLPVCPTCGWGATAREGRGRSSWPGKLLTGLLLFLGGLGAGALTGLMLFNVIAWIVFGPVCTVGVAKAFPRAWLVTPVCYAAGFAVGLTWLAIRVGPLANESAGGGAQGLALAITGFSVPLAWFIGWLRHSD